MATATADTHAPVRDTTESAPSSQTRRQNALADIQFASIIDDDLTPSEDESPEDRALQLETVQSAIGISIGQQQTRLTSPKTPAAEKAAALEDTGLFDAWEDTVLPITTDSAVDTEDEPSASRLGLESSREEYALSQQPSAQSPQRLPSPWRAGPKTFRQTANDHRSALRQHFQGGRRRASSSGSMAEGMRKYMPFNIPSSIPKSYKDLHFSLPSFSSLSIDTDRSRTGPGLPDRRRRETISGATRLTQLDGNGSTRLTQLDGNGSSTLHERRASGSSATSKQARTDSIPKRELIDESTSTLLATPSRQSRDRPPQMLRRSTSEGSLAVYRTTSLASSLGDDSRFESVQEMVNSRLKAIRDSWQDSNFKLPSPSFPNFNFGNRDDFFRTRNINMMSSKGRENENGNVRQINYRPGTSPSLLQRRSNPKETVSDSDPPTFFSQALQQLEGDLVILGGYRGSILRSAEPPNRQVWVPIKVGLNLRKVDLEVPLDPDADERMEETIYPSGMLTHIGPVDISKRLFKRLKACDNAKNGKLRVHNYGYDWRLSPHFLSKRLIAFLESLPCNQSGVPPEKRGALVLAHSLGGLIMRHAINKRPELVRGIVYAGVPQRCVNILGPFRNGDDVLFSSRVLTASVNFSIRTSYALLPLDGKCFFNKYDKTEYPVDFFDVKTWKDCRLSPVVAAPLPRPDSPKDSSFSVSNIVSAMSSALPSFPVRKPSFSFTKTFTAESGESQTSSETPAKGPADSALHAAQKVGDSTAQSSGLEPQMSQHRPPLHHVETSKEPVPASDVTIPYDKAMEYLERVLAETKAFKQELAHIPEHSQTNSYPPIAIIYGKSTPTVYGAKVESREAIKRADVYDELAFASGDGVVLARAAMVPEGYSVVKGGAVSSDRGHVTLLGDLEAVGRCLLAVMRARRGGVGLGPQKKRSEASQTKSESSGVLL